MEIKKIDIINGISITRVIEKLGIHIDTKTSKTQIRMKCFIHNSKDNDLSIFTHTNSFRCWGSGCEASGGNFQLVQKKLNLSDSEVYSWFEANFSEVPSSNNLKYSQKLKFKFSTNKPIQEKTKEQETKDYSHVYKATLEALPGITENHYLIKERDLPLELVRKQGIKSYYKDFRYQLINTLRKQFNDDILFESGVLQLDKYGNPSFSLWFCETIIPMYKDSKLITLQGRQGYELSPNKPKYQFLIGKPTPDIFIPEQHIDQFPFVYVTEGVITALTFIQQGSPAIALTSNHAGTKQEKIIKELDPLKDKCFMLAPDANDTTNMGKVRIALQKHGFSVEEKIYDIVTEAEKKGLKPSDIIDPTNGKYRIKDLNDLLLFIKKRDTLQNG
jgi:hypothetical protein